MTDNKKNRGLSGITLFLFVLIVLGALWFTNTLDSKESQLSRQKFEKLITSEKVDSVTITQNKNVPTGSVEVQLKNKKNGENEKNYLYVSDVNEIQKYLDKAEVLIEALPYIQRFNRKIIVVKYGGSAMVDEELKARVIQDVTLLKLVGFKPIIVHGGGKEISKWVGKVGMEPHFINGLRVTDADTMELAEMVLGKVNKSLVQLVESLGVRAIGISGKDGGLLKVDKKYADGEDIGFVGDVKEVNADIIFDLLEKDFLPIIAPIGLDDDFNTYNINADDAACAIAKAINAEKLAFLTDIEGVYKDPKDPSTLISELNVSEGKKLMEDGFIGGGMLPKLHNCIDAIENGVSRVHILDGRIPHCLLLEIFTNKGIGTAIKNDVDERYYHGE